MFPGRVYAHVSGFDILMAEACCNAALWRYFRSIKPGLQHPAYFYSQDLGRWLEGIHTKPGQRRKLLNRINRDDELRGTMHRLLTRFCVYSILAHRKSNAAVSKQLEADAAAQKRAREEQAVVNNPAMRIFKMVPVRVDGHGDNVREGGGKKEQFEKRAMAR